MHGIIRLFDGRHVDLSRILEIGAPTVVAGHPGFDILYMLQDRPCRASYSIRSLVGDQAYFDTHNETLLPVALQALEKHVTHLATQWIEFRKEESAALLRAKTGRPYGNLEIGI